MKQLGELKLGELLDTPPPGLDEEAIAISKVAAVCFRSCNFSNPKNIACSLESSLTPHQLVIRYGPLSLPDFLNASIGKILKVITVSESSRLHASLKKENVPVKRLVVNQILPPYASDCKFCAMK